MVLGESQFCPLESSQPHIGGLDSIEKVVEYKVEMMCVDEFVDARLPLRKKIHSYEEVAVDAWCVAAL